MCFLLRLTTKWASSSGGPGALKNRIRRRHCARSPVRVRSAVENTMYDTGIFPSELISAYRELPLLPDPPRNSSTTPVNNA